MDTADFLRQEIEKEKEELFGSDVQRNLYKEIELLFDLIEGEIKEHCSRRKIPLYRYLAEKLQKQGFTNANEKLLGDYMAKIRKSRANGKAKMGVAPASLGKTVPTKLQPLQSPATVSPTVGITSTPASQPESFVKVKFSGSDEVKEYFASLGVDLDDYPDIYDKEVSSPSLYGDWQKIKASGVTVATAPEFAKDVLRSIRNKVQRQYPSIL